MPIKPVLQALVLADHIYIDANTGKKIIAGTFNHLAANEFPSQSTTHKFAFVSMTDVYGPLEVMVRYVDLVDNRVLFELRNMQVQSQDPLDTVELVVEVPPLPMPHAGAFAFEVHADNEMLGALRLIVTRRGDEDDEEREETESE